MPDGVVRKTRRHQKVHACCAGRYGRQRRYSMFWPAATTFFLFGLFAEDCAIFFKNEGGYGDGYILSL